MLNPFRSSGTTKPPLATVVYRSRAVKALSPPELHELTRTAQQRNEREAVTGLMLYDNERFFQWLEGPPDNVDRVMGSIRADRRHTEIEVLDSKATQERTFDGWTMKLATRVPDRTSWLQDAIEPPRAIVEGLHSRPEAAPVLLVKLLPLSAREAEDASMYDAIGRMPLHSKTAAVLKSVILAKVIPQLSGGRVQAGPAANPRAAELAELLIAADDAAARELIAEVCAPGNVTPLAYASLFEPAARSLGDLWSEDACSEFDVTLGLCRLQNALRMLTAGAPVRGAGRAKQPLVLIAPEPGELHRLGAALDSTILRNAGWSPHCAYPADNATLQDLVSSTWFDVLDLSLSVAFRREDRLPWMTETIAGARRASRNPGLVVVVGGRVFLEDRQAGADVGADLSSTTAFGVDRSILNTVAASKTTASTPLDLLEATALPS